MRVLHVNSTAAKAGGTEVFMYDLLAWQRQQGIETGLFAGTTGDPREDAETCLIKRQNWDPTALFVDPPAADALRRFLDRFRPDVIHLHNLHAFPISAIAALGAAEVPLVQHIHDASSFCANAWLTLPDGQICPGGVGQKCLQSGCQKNYPYDGRILTSVAARSAALRATVDHWITSSQTYRELCERHGFAPAACIPLWSPTPSTPRSASTDRRPLVLSIGRLVPEKGVVHLLRAWPRVRAAFPAAELLIAGEGPERAALEQLAAQAGLDPQQVFKGRIPHEEVDALMRRAKLLVVPSIWFEAYGLTIVEAQRAGLPPVISRIGGMAELVEHERSGLLVEPRDAEALAAAILRLLGDPELYERCVAGCLRAAASREADTPMRAILDVYAAAKRRGRGHRRPVDLDGLHCTDALLQDFHRVESWALDMKKHIEYLEGIGRADQPVKSFARHMKFWLKSKRPEK